MRSLGRCTHLLLLGNGFLWRTSGAVVPLPPDITPAPSLPPQYLDAQRIQGRQEDPDAIDFLNILITALPQSLRQIAATNVPAVSSILWSEFLDDNRPQWFQDLPYQIQSYLIDTFGPVTAAPPQQPQDSAAVPTSVSASLTTTRSGYTTQTWGSQVSATPESSTLLGSESESIRSTSMASPSLSSRSLSSAFPSGQSSTLSTSRIPSSSSSFSSSSASTVPVSTSPPSSAPPSSTPSSPVAPDPSSSGLTGREKLSIGIGIPLGLLFLSALIFTSCVFVRRHRKRLIQGSQPPSSPGFIPRFSFQTGDADGYTVPLTHGHGIGSADDRNWDDEAYDADGVGYAVSPVASTTTSSSTQDAHMPMLAPALYHSHSSNRARGRRLSTSSLHSVAEMREPEDAESPVLGRYHSQRRRVSAAGITNGRNETLRSSIRRKPVPTQTDVRGYPGDGHGGGGVEGSDVAMNAGIGGAQHAVSRPTLAFPHTAAQHSGTGSSSSGLAVSSFSSSSFDAYLEDYGPEYYYAGGGYGGGYSEQEQDADENLGFGGEMREVRGRNSSKTEWPLRDYGGAGHFRA